MPELDAQFLWHVVRAHSVQVLASKAVKLLEDFILQSRRAFEKRSATDFTESPLWKEWCVLWFEPVCQALYSQEVGSDIARHSLGQVLHFVIDKDHKVGEAIMEHFAPITETETR